MNRPRTHSRTRVDRLRWAVPWALLASGLVGLTIAVAVRFPAGSIATGVILALGLGWALGRVAERARWSRPVGDLSRNLAAFVAQPDEVWNLPATPDLADLVAPVRDLQERYRTLRSQVDRRSGDPLGDSSLLGLPFAQLTRSGSIESPVLEATMASGEFSTLDMINRLDPKTLRWLDSSPTEQVFLGWNLAELKTKSFLDVIVPDDRKLARQELRTVLERGEAHGLIYRIKIASGETRAVELHVGVRYAPDGRILHLRSHLTDVTAKLHDESELKRRTEELTRAVDELRRANRELVELKDRYGDLYQNAPAMYFTADRLGLFVECNETLVRTLGYGRDDLIGQPVLKLLPVGPRVDDHDPFREALRGGPTEFEIEWAKVDGQVIDVWVTGTAVVSPDGKVRHVRFVAKDVTARRTLEAELRVKNEHLARANAELSRKNKELDEFTYVVSHDLQEPLRTLIAFSDFLIRDQGDRLDETGRDYVQHLVDASRRLRSLIQDLLKLSKAGRVTSEFAAVSLDEVAGVVKADLAELIRSKNAEVAIEGPLPDVWGDRDRIGQLLANLVGNGLKYNERPDPRVEIGAEGSAGGRTVTLRVRDNGIGIDPKFHAKIFQLFRRLHTREEYEGTGAGLAICQKIVQAHGGRIWVESEPGHGSTFFVSLPGLPSSRSQKGDRHFADSEPVPVL